MIDMPLKQITVIAQDPTVTSVDGGVITTRVEIPNEYVAPGPRGSRFEVVDYDSTTDIICPPHNVIGDEDRFADVTDVQELCSNLAFHAQNTYAIAASTLFEFEKALGRRVPWRFSDQSHQLKLLPHAFSEANAFYSPRDQCLAFGYFPVNESTRASENTLNYGYTCLSHDIVAHETTHALLDGLRSGYTLPSSRDQAAFHEGISDSIALLMVLRSEELLIEDLRKHRDHEEALSEGGTVSVKTCKDVIEKHRNISARSDDERTGTEFFVLGVAEQVGAYVHGGRQNPLRRSSRLKPTDRSGIPVYQSEEYDAPHRRGEILVAAILHSFLNVLERRLEEVGRKFTYDGEPLADRARLSLTQVAREGAKAAQHLLTMTIRAIDYLPPVHVDFREFLTALLTADTEVNPDDTEYQYREAITEGFVRFGITPSIGAGLWTPGVDNVELVYSRRSRVGQDWTTDGVFEFLWSNFEAFKLVRNASTHVKSVSPVRRIGPDGFVLDEVVAQYMQIVREANADDLSSLKVERDRLGYEKHYTVVGGGTIIFDNYGRVKYHIHNRINSSRQQGRLLYLESRERYSEQASLSFAQLHEARDLDEDVSRRPSDWSW